VTAPLTYVYCLVRSPRAPSLPPAAIGVPGARDVRLLDAGTGVRAVVSTVPAADYDERALAQGLRRLDWVGRRAMAHEAVVEHFLTAPAVLPMQLFSLFTSDDRALAHIARDRRRIDRILARLERKLEWGLRLTFDERSARAMVEEAHDGRSDQPPSRLRRSAEVSAKAERTGPTRSGAAYLARKRDLLDVTRGQLAAARKEADHLFTVMAREASESRRRRSTESAASGSRLLLDAAFLVPAKRTGAFRTALRRQARSLKASGIVVSLTGPWPPYNFIDAKAGPRSSS
jgi:hypothetical protein